MKCWGLRMDVRVVEQVILTASFSSLFLVVTQRWEGGWEDVPAAVGGAVDARGIEERLAVVEPIVHRGVVFGVEVQIDCLGWVGG